MIAILGAGIAGLSAASFLKQRGLDAVVLEQSRAPGGLARSFEWHSVWCDLGAHRLHAQSRRGLESVQSLVRLHRHRRRSRIYFSGAWLNDPFHIVEVARHCPPVDVLRAAIDYAARPRRSPADSFESEVIRRYGRHLYRLLFKPYTERLLGLPGEEIAIEWAHRKARLASPLDRFRRSTPTRFGAFYYPARGGYGAIAQALHLAIRERVRLNARVVGLDRLGDRVTRVRFEQDGELKSIPVEAVVSTLTMNVNARLLALEPPGVDYQALTAVYLHLNRPHLTPNHWLYFMDADSTINRLVEFKNMSLADAPGEQTVVCAEVTRETSQPIDLVVRDILRAGLIRPDEVLDACVVREPFAYPRYRRDYPARANAFRAAAARYRNFYSLGRAAQFDHLEVDDVLDSAHALAGQLALLGGADGRERRLEAEQFWKQANAPLA